MASSSHVADRWDDSLQYRSDVRKGSHHRSDPDGISWERGGDKLRRRCRGFRNGTVLDSSRIQTGRLLGLAPAASSTHDATGVVFGVVRATSIRSVGVGCSGPIGAAASSGVSFSVARCGRRPLDGPSRARGRARGLGRFGGNHILEVPRVVDGRACLGSVAPGFLRRFITSLHGRPFAFVAARSPEPRPGADSP